MTPTVSRLSNWRYTCPPSNNRTKPNPSSRTLSAPEPAHTPTQEQRYTCSVAPYHSKADRTRKVVLTLCKVLAGHDIRSVAQTLQSLHLVESLTGAGMGRQGCPAAGLGRGDRD